MKTQIITFKKELVHFIWGLFWLCNVGISNFYTAQVCIGNWLLSKEAVSEFSSIEINSPIHADHSVGLQNFGTKSKAFTVCCPYSNQRSVNRKVIALKKGENFKIVTKNLPV